MLHDALTLCLLLISLPLLESSHRYSQTREYLAKEPHSYHQAEDCPPKLTKSCTTSTLPSSERVKTVECHPGPPKKVCKKEPQPIPGCLDVPQPPDQECLDRVEEICQDMASELCKVETCETEVRLMCDIEVETKCRLIEGSSPEGSEKCAGLRAQGIDCHPLIAYPVPADEADGVEQKGDNLADPVPSDDGSVEVWETCEEVPLMRSSCIGQVCHDIPVTGRQCDGLDLENCQEVAVSELKCRQVSTAECQALWDQGGDCHYVLDACPVVASLPISQCAGQENSCWAIGQPDVDCPNYGLCCFNGCANVCSAEGPAPLPAPLPVPAPIPVTRPNGPGALQAFEICEDYPGGEVCKEVEVEVCQPSDNEEDKLCPEVEVKQCRAEMAKECTPEPVCKPLSVVETCEDVPGDNICEEVWTTEEATKKERTCEQKVLCCGEPCPVEKRHESILKKIKPWKESILKKTQPWKESILKKTKSWQESILKKTKSWQESFLKKTKPWPKRLRGVQGSHYSKTL